MASPLSGSLARTLGSALASTFLDATLTRAVPVAGANPWDPPASSSDTTYSCRAIPDTWGATWFAGGLVASDEAKILILASTLATDPQPGDKITVRSETYTIVPAGSGKPAVAVDPALACWECRAKR
jgi:hypothetical protein